jgi:3-oxoacyl-[acyl-carrier protein] reductase
MPYIGKLIRPIRIGRDRAVFSNSAMTDFEDKVALITGASRGIGAVVAEELAERGAAVSICARTEPLELASRLRERGASVLSLRADIGNEQDVRRVVEETVQTLGRVDIAVCNAGVRSTAANADLDADEWKRVLDINLIGTFNTARAAIEDMRSRGYGRIVIVSSIAGRVGGTLVNVAYSAAKAGLIVMTKALAKETAPLGITVNCIAAGTIDTPFIEDYDEPRRERLLTLIPLGRLGQAQDVSAAVRYFASDEAEWVTGVTLDVNGGQFMG